MTCPNSKTWGDLEAGMQDGEGQGTDGLKDCYLKTLRNLGLKERDLGKQQRGKAFFIDGATFHHLSKRIQEMA